VVLNVLVKAATSPYNLLAKGLGVDEEQLKFVRMELLQEELGPEQTTQLDMLAQVLEEKPELGMTATLNVNQKTEAEAIRYYLAKRGMYLQQKYGSDSALVQLSAVDKIKIVEMEENEAFVRFLQNKTGAPSEVQKVDELIDLYVTPAAISREQNRLNQVRMAALKAYIAQNPTLAKGFKISDDISVEEDKKRPRFNLSYDVME
jgi:hypothetical protein